MSTNPAPQRKHLAARVFSKAWVRIVWIVFLAIVVTRLWWIRDALLVWWVYGRDAYFRDGVRVLPGKPTRFSTGELAPQWPNIATGFSFIIVVVFGLSILLVLGLRFYERWRPHNATEPAAAEPGAAPHRGGR